MPGIKSLYRGFRQGDAFITAGLYELSEIARRGWNAYASFLEHFRVFGIWKVLVGLLSSAASIGLIAAIAVIIYALPPFSGTGDIWNQRRKFAVTLTDPNGEIIGRRGIRQDDAIPLSEIPPNVIHAVLDTEDSRFYQHFGVDVQGVLRAMVVNARAKGVRQGGSTLTQQLAKNLFLTPDQTLRRKVHEAFLALWIEARLSKDQILKMYLDRSYLGGGTYGVEAASQFYFGKSVRDVNLSEAAMLGGLFKAPSSYAPHVNLAAAKARANVVLYRMLDVGDISQGELLQARRHPVQMAPEQNFYSPGYFIDYAYKEALAIMEQQGLTQDFVIEVKTTVDVNLQRTAQKIIDQKLKANGDKLHIDQAAMVSMTPQGELKAIIGGRNYEDSQFNRATEAMRQPGSAFKPFVYLAALEAGYTPRSTVYDTPITIRGWTPRNYSHRYIGKTNLTYALEHSINTIPIHLMKDIGREAIVKAAEEAGIQTPLLKVPSMPLGTNEMTVLDLTTGYAAFANGGKRVLPYSVTEIRRPNGDLLYSRQRDAAPIEQTIDPEKIADLNFMLNRVVMSGTARRAQIGFTPQAGKTGTTQSYRDAWFAGFTAHYVTAVWYGNDDYSEMNRVTGGSLPALTWHDVMVKAHRTKIAAALPGIPLDGRYSRYIARNQNKLELPLAPEAARPKIRGSNGGSTTTSPSNDVYVVKKARNKKTRNKKTARAQPAPVTKRKKNGVSDVLQDMFKLFKNKEKRQRAAKRKKVYVFKPKKTTAPRKKRGHHNAKKLRSLLGRD